MKLWDLRLGLQSVSTTMIHSEEAMSIDFSPVNQNLAITWSNDKTIKLWDLRKLCQNLHTFMYHRDAVTVAKFSPHDDELIASGSKDWRVFIWKLPDGETKISPSGDQEGPPELVFIHGGHITPICDLDWNKNDRFMLASTSENNVLQIWKMANKFFKDLISY